MRKFIAFARNTPGVLIFLCLCLLPGTAPAQSAGVNPTGWIETRGWNLLLSLLQDGGCEGGGTENMLRNWVAPHQIGEENPRAGDSWSIDFNQEAAASGYSFGGISEVPLWVSVAWLNERFDADFPDEEVIDLLELVETINDDFLPSGSTPVPSTGVLAVATTYLSNHTGAPLEVEICTASDDSIQVWVNDQVTTNVSACREIADDCEDARPAVLPEGISKIAVLVWQGTEGWGFRLGVRSPAGGSLYDDGDVSQLEFLGTDAGANCPAQGDTHATGLTVAPDGGLPGEYLATATAIDDGGETVLYTFTASNGIDPPQVSGPQTGTTAAFTLGAGEWTISVLVDDDPACPDEAADARASKSLTVAPPTCGLTLTATFDAATGQALLHPAPVEQGGCECDEYVVRREGTEIFRGSYGGPDRAFPFPADCAPGQPVKYSVACLGPGGEGTAADSTLLCPDDNGGEVIILPLELGTPSPVAFSADRRRIWYRLEAPQALGRLVRVSLTAPDPADANALYLRWGEVPLPHHSDQAADVRNRADQELIIPYFQGGALYLLVQNNLLNGSGNGITLLATLDEAVLTKVRPGSVGRRNLGLLTLTMEGGGFQQGTVFTLRNPITGKTFPMTSAVVGSSSLASATFDLASAPAGNYELIAQVPGLSTEKLENAFQITNTRRGPLLKVELRGSERYRNGVPDVLFLHCSNVGDEAMSAPFLKVVGPEATAPKPQPEFRLKGEGDFATDLPQLICVDPGTLTPTLEPGSSVVIPVEFRLHQNGIGLFRVYLFTPGRNDYVPWDSYSAPPGLSAGEWSALMPLLADELGYTWPEYQQSLANRAARLARRRAVNPFSVRESFRFAARETLDLPSSALVGQVRQSPEGFPLAGKSVLALEGGLVKAFAVTDVRGFYTLDWLEGGHTYQLRMVDHDPAVQIVVPAEGDVLGVDFLAAAAANGLSPACPNCATGGLPDRPVVPPEALFTQVATFTIEVGQAIDPNTKEGPAGQGGDQHLIGLGDPLWYKINFENEGTKGSFAQKVELDDGLRRELDMGSITPRSVGVFQSPEDTEGKNFVFDEGSSSAGNGEGTLQGVGEKGEWDVKVTVKFDPATGLLNCTFDTYFAGTRNKPPRSDFGLGFLPQGGTGHMYFEASPAPGLPDGTVMTNEAEITFDETSSLKTNQTRHTFTSMPPQLPQDPVPGDGAQGVRIGTTLGWTSRRAGSFDVYLWKRNAQFPRPVRVELNGFTPAAPLEPGSVYLWQVVAINSNGESQGDQWLFETERDPSPPGAPANPFPSDLAAEVPVDRPLSFAPGEGAASHQVFLWTEGQLPPRLPVPLSLTRFEPALQPQTTYQWQVRAVNITGATDGPVWRFRTGSAPLARFIRGDVNADLSVDISDAVVNLNFQFLGSAPPSCVKAADTDDSGLVDISDAVTVLNYLFLSGPLPGVPFPDCGLDQVPDTLTCESHGCP